LGQAAVASGKKNASRLRAHIVFLDESGLLMTPLLRRSWAPVGQTPILYQRTRSRQKVSMIAALSISPRRRRVGLYFSLLPNQNVTAVEVIAFLRQLRAHLGRSIIVIWDRLNAHRARLTNAYLCGQRAIRPEFLPPYAPELNPVEIVWSYMKLNPLANLAATDALELSQIADREARAIQDDQSLLPSFIRAGPLFIRL
jgi:transposase